MTVRRHLGRRTAESSAARDLMASQNPWHHHAAADDVEPSDPGHSTLALRLEPMPADEAVGRFHYGILLGNHPHVLATWRVISDRLCVVERVAELLGGRTCIPDAHMDGEVVTGAATVDVILGDPSAIDVRWYLNDDRTCDEPGECRCPRSLPERRIAARAGWGCEPRVRVCFRLHQDAGLGTFMLFSGAWSLVEDATRARQALRRCTGPVVAHLGLERHVFAPHSGGRVAYTRPRLISSQCQDNPLEPSKPGATSDASAWSRRGPAECGSRRASRDQRPHDHD